ncbi:DUF6683 family protein [Pedobacter africanus]|nr:DUF6683 family protein [Pedobacter africanus]
MKSLRTVLILVVIALIAGNKTLAQIGNPGLMYQGAFNNAMFLTTKGAIERGMKSRPSAVNTAKSSLNFVSTPEVHNKVLELIASLAAKGDKDKIKSAAAIIEKANFLDEFDKVLKPYGFNSHNMPDVFTAFIVLSWQAVKGSDASKYPEGIQIFRKQIHSVMNGNATLSKFTNAQKQEMSETLAYMAMLFTYGNQNQIKSGNTAALAATRENIRQGVIKVSGIDLTKYTLSNEGFN